MNVPDNRTEQQIEESIARLEADMTDEDWKNFIRNLGPEDEIPEPIEKLFGWPTDEPKLI